MYSLRVESIGIAEKTFKPGNLTAFGMSSVKSLNCLLDSSLGEIKKVGLAMGKGAVFIKQHPLDCADGYLPKQKLGHRPA